MPSPVQFAMRTSHTKLYYTPGKIPPSLGVSNRGKSPRRSQQALQWKEEQCEELRKKNCALQASKQRLRCKLGEAVRRHEQLASEHQAIVSQGQQLRAQTASLAEQLLSLSSQLNTEKVKCEQQLRAARNGARRCLELDQQREHLEQQVKQLHYSLQCSHQQSSILRTELQHRCDQVEHLTQDHNALLTKFRELTVLMSEAHNKLNTAVAQSGKAMAKDHTKTALRTWSQSNIATSLRHLKHKLPFSKEPPRPSSSAAHQETIPAFRAAHHKATHTPVASRMRPGHQQTDSPGPLHSHCLTPPSMPPLCIPPQKPHGAGSNSPDVRPAYEYTCKKDLKKVTKALLQTVADRDIPSGVSGAGWGPSRAAAHSPFGGITNLGRNARPNFFTHMPSKPDWWPLKEWQDSQFLERADSGAIAAVHDAALVHILAG
ncbi:TPA: hypothetical protein ACH3X1_014034 [Trebouxia sp. C0004]